MLFMFIIFCIMYCLFFFYFLFLNFFTVANFDDGYLHVYTRCSFSVASICSVNLAVMMPNLFVTFCNQNK